MSEEKKKYCTIYFDPEMRVEGECPQTLMDDAIERRLEYFDLSSVYYIDEKYHIQFYRPLNEEEKSPLIQEIVENAEKYNELLKEFERLRPLMDYREEVFLTSDFNNARYYNLRAQALLLLKQDEDIPSELLEEGAINEEEVEEGGAVRPTTAIRWHLDTNKKRIEELKMKIGEFSLKKKAGITEENPLREFIRKALKLDEE